MRHVLWIAALLTGALTAAPLRARTPAKTVAGKLYFHWCGDEARLPESVKTARAAERPVDGNPEAYTDPVPRVFRYRTRPENAAIRALLAGPSERERAAGYDTELTYLSFVRIRFDDRRGRATLDLKSTRSGYLAGLLSTPRLGEQALKTLAQFGHVKTVRIRINGRLDWVEAGPDGRAPGIFSLSGR